jgi:glycerol kinase
MSLGESRALILAIDQGTTGTTAVLYELDAASGGGVPASGGQSPGLRSLARVSVEFPQHFPEPGWVEHDPEELWQSVVAAAARVLQVHPGAERFVRAIGLTNQRETMLLWERRTGRPVGRAIVWQDRRTSERCLALRQTEHAELIRQQTGLVVDPYFSATKLEWMLRSDPSLVARAKSGELCFGTIDSYLVSRISGRQAEHVIEFTNASRTMLVDIRKGAYSPELCELFGVPDACLPRIVGSTQVVAETRGFSGLPDGIPISGIAGDQHAALFGQGAGPLGEGKCTYGTGAFLLVTTGSVPVLSTHGLLTTPAWQLSSGVTYALEGSAFVAGALVQWLRDGLGIIKSASEIEELARSVADSGGLSLVPALAGLGAPYWEPRARGMITGITRGTGRAHLARAALEAVAHEVSDLLEAVNSDLGAAGLSPLGRLRVDGGAAHNNLLLELQANFAGTRVERGRDVESTARGAALLAAMGAGLIEEQASHPLSFELDRAFVPAQGSKFGGQKAAYHASVDACLALSRDPRVH